jgi:hypothetical protein
VGEDRCIGCQIDTVEWETKTEMSWGDWARREGKRRERGKRDEEEDEEEEELKCERGGARSRREVRCGGPSPIRTRAPDSLCRRSRRTHQRLEDRIQSGHSTRAPAPFLLVIEIFRGP